jgi:hypothetical protein
VLFQLSYSPEKPQVMRLSNDLSNRVPQRHLASSGMEWAVMAASPFGAAVAASPSGEHTIMSAEPTCSAGRVALALVLQRCL